ncbi:MAG: tandem-95 repeat protein [Magnetococcales bacterium]|nr:tandem-95 repeat protein [Magnetococcales bacterium]
MKSKKWVGLCAASAFALFAAGCGGGGGTGTTTGGLSGTVADGLAMANAKVTVQSATGAIIDVGTTDASGQYAGFSFPAGFAFPAVMTVTRVNGKDLLRTIIPNQPGGATTTNINPITQTITTQMIPTGGSLAGLDVGDGDNGFTKKAKAVVQTAFGSAMTYDTFAGKPFKARTASDPKAGGLADTLIDTLAGLDPTRKPEDLLASATDTKDPSVSKDLMSNPAFQARFAGELISQGRPAGEVKTLIQAEAVSGSDTTVLLANTETYAKAFEEVFTSANSALTGSDSQKRASLEAIVESAAVTVARIVEKKGVTGGDALTNMLSNSMTLVKEPLIAIGKTDQGGENLALILAATREQMSDLINTSTVDLTQSGANVATLGTQVKNFGEIVSSAVSHSLKSGKDKSKLDDKEKWLVATNMGKGIASSLTSYMSDMAVDSSAMTDAQKANMAKAGNAAKNTATALDSALVAMAADQDADAMEDDMLDSMAGALVAQSAQTFKNYDMTVDASTFSGAAAKSLTNMAKLVVDNTAILHGQATALNSNKQAALVEAMAGQLLNELKNMDLTGDELPESATNVANNLARAVGPALVEKVGQSSDYQGSNFQILATQAAANAVTELKKTATLTGTIDSETLTRLQQGASSAAETSRTTMEATFKTIEEQGISLAEITGGLAESGLDGAAMDVVMYQVQSTLASGGTVMKDAARDIAETAAFMANAVLENGGSLTQVRDTIAAPMAAMAQIAQGQDGQSSEQILASIRGSANTMEQTAQAMASSRDMSLENFILTTGNIAAVVGTQLTGDATDALLSSVRGNVATGEGMTLETLAGQPSQHNENILTQAIAQQAVIQEQATVMLQSVNRLPEFIPFAENLRVDMGKTYTGLLPIKDEEGETNLTFRIITSGEKGTATITNPQTGAFTYQPRPGFVGPDTFTFVINDGIGETTPASVTMHVVNTLPEFLPPTETIIAQAGQPIQGILPIKNDQTGETLTFRIVTQGNKGAITLDNPATGAFTYRPNPGTFGPDTFTFAVSDGAGETAPIPMTVQVVNQPPRPVADTLTITAGQTLNGTLAVSNADGDSLAYRIITQGTKGTVTMTNAATGAYTYIPNPGAYGTDTFTFIVNDGIADSEAVTATVNIDVDAAVSFAEPAQRVLDGHTAFVVVRLSTPSGKNMTVPYAISGSSTAGEDFSVPAAGMSITIPSGQVEAEIPVTLADNSNTEGEETVVLNLGTPVHGHMGAIASHTVTIVSAPSMRGGKDAGE